MVFSDMNLPLFPMSNRSTDLTGQVNPFAKAAAPSPIAELLSDLFAPESQEGGNLLEILLASLGDFSSMPLDDSFNGVSGYPDILGSVLNDESDGLDGAILNDMFDFLSATGRSSSRRSSGGEFALGSPASFIPRSKRAGRGGRANTRSPLYPQIPTNASIKTVTQNNRLYISKTGCPTVPVFDASVVRPERRQYVDQARQFARKAGMDPYEENIFVRQIYRESRFNPRATGPLTRWGHAQGIAQIIPAKQSEWGVRNAYNPTEALNVAARKMKGYFVQYGNYEAALSAYNAGEGNALIGHKINETRTYQKLIMGRGRLYEGDVPYKADDNAPLTS